MICGQRLTAETELQLFQAGQAKKNYVALLDHLTKAPTKILFSDGRQFQVRGELGRGGATRIYRTSPGALRLAAAEDQLALLGAFVRAHRTLHENGVLVPRLLGVGPQPAHTPNGVEYVWVEEVAVIFRLDEWLTSLPFAQLQRTPAWNALEDFARSTWRFVTIGDFKPENIVWTGQQWLLLDWTAALTLLPSASDPGLAAQTVFWSEKMEQLPRSNWRTKDLVYAELDRQVRDERARHGRCDALLNPRQLRAPPIQWFGFELESSLR